MAAPDPAAPAAREDDDGAVVGTDGAGPAGTDVARAATVVVAAVAQVLAGPLGYLLPGARSATEVADAYATDLAPAGYAVAVWAPVLLVGLAWAVYQALPSQLGAPAHRRAGWPLAVAFAATAGVGLARPQDGDAVLVVQAFLVVAVAATALGLGRLQDPEPGGPARLLPCAAAALLMGGLTVATVAQVVVVGVHLGAPAEGGLARGAGVVALLAAAAVVLDVTLRLPVSAGPFALAAGWGLLGVARHDPPLSVGLAAWAAVAVVAVGLLVMLWRTRRPVRVLLG